MVILLLISSQMSFVTVSFLIFTDCLKCGYVAQYATSSAYCAMPILGLLGCGMSYIIRFFKIWFIKLYVLIIYNNISRVS